MSRQQDQLNLEPMEVPKDSRLEGVRTSCSDVDDDTRDASYLFDKALDDAEMTTQEAAAMMGSKGKPLSESLVNRMRSPNYRECVSLVQLLKCGPVVTWKFSRRLHAKKKHQQLALRETMQALSLLAVGID